MVETGANWGGPIPPARLHSSVVVEKHRPRVHRPSAYKEELNILELYDNFSDLSM